MNADWIITVFVIIDTLMERLGHHSDVRANVPDAEILTIAVVAAKYFLNHHVSVGVVVPVQFGPGVSTTVQNPGQKPVDGHLNGTTVGGMFRLSVYAP